MDVIILITHPVRLSDVQARCFDVMCLSEQIKLYDNAVVKVVNVGLSQPKYNQSNIFLDSHNYNKIARLYSLTNNPYDHILLYTISITFSRFPDIAVNLFFLFSYLLRLHLINLT